MKIWTNLILSLLLSHAAYAQAAERPTGPTRPARSEFFTSEGAMVFVEKTKTDALFALTLSLHRDLPPNAQVKVLFENPSVPGEFFEVPVSVQANRTIMAQSPRFEGIKNQRSYLSKTLVTDDSGQVVSSHEQWIWFYMPPQLRSEFKTRIID